MLHEIALLATIRHPDLVMFLGCCLEDSPIMFISEFMPGGDLERYYASKQVDGHHWAPPMKTVNRWGRTILRALDFLHNCSQPIIHRDLKPMNILLTEGLEVKVTDFGISKVTRRVSQTSSETYKACGNDSYSMTGGVGSWRYMAPEVARYQPYTEKVDVYSAALILYFMSTGRQPFHEYEDPKDVLDEYAKGNEPRPNLVECPSSFRRIMAAGWDQVPENRPSAGDLVERLVEIHNVQHKCTCTLM
jgi:serine/threonine protein kinase